MTNPTGTQWETALLNKLTSNGERIAVVEKEVKDVKQIVTNLDQRLTNVEKEVKDTKQIVTNLDQRLTNVEKEVKDTKQIVTNLDQRLTSIESLLGWLKVIGGGVVAIALSLIANFLYSFLN